MDSWIPELPMSAVIDSVGTFVQIGDTRLKTAEGLKY